MEDGILNTARVCLCVAIASGRTLRSIVNGIGTSWNYLIQGDDALLACGFPLDMEKYTTASESRGYETKIQHGQTFLMTYLGGGVPTGLPGRMVMQTLTRERPTRSSIVELLGLISRWERLGGPALRLGRLCFQAIARDSKLLRERRIFTFEDLMLYARSGKWRTELELELRKPGGAARELAELQKERTLQARLTWGVDEDFESPDDNLLSDLNRYVDVPSILGKQSESEANIIGPVIRRLHRLTPDRLVSEAKKIFESTARERGVA
jgi:hypothetical protein